MKGRYLITSSEWFIGKDGRYYKAVWGDVEIVQDEFLGIKTNARSTNWYAKIGTEENHIIIAGCQIKHAVRCEEKPNDGETRDFNYHDGRSVESVRPSVIYIAE